MTSPSLATCYHEAAHGVATLAAGMRLRRVSVKAYLDVGGISIPDHKVGDWTPEQLLLVTLSGPMSEARYSGRPLELSGGDLRNVKALVGLLARDDDTEARVLERFTILTRAKLEAWWPAIVQVAEALHAHGDLDGDAVERLAADVLYQAEGWVS